jgi:putative FmdB family regulatory protein
MPIYAYRCGACGHARDILQKLSDPILTTCPACGAEAFSKQVTAAGFQLKGSGWYVTDFRDGGKKAGTKDGGTDGGKDGGKDGDAKADAPKPADGGDKAAAAAAAAAPAPVPAATPSPAPGAPSNSSS